MNNLFKSARERRLWLITAAIVIAIYTTLSYTPALAERLYNQNFAAFAFGSSMLLVGLTILTQGLKNRPRGLEIGVFLGILTVYALLFLRLTLPERSHLIEYSILAVIIFEALMERLEQGGSIPVPWLVAIVITSLIGVVDEMIQLYLPNRVFDWEDIIFNTLASMMAVVSMVALNWARQRWQASRDE